MLIVDVLIVCLAIAIALWGYMLGVTHGGVMALGFAAGALVGSRVAPLALDDGLHDPLAPVLALPGALLLGAIGASAAEGLSDPVRKRLETRNLVDGLAGALLAGTLCLLGIWLIGAVAGSFDSLEDSVGDSAVIEELNGVLPPPGPLLKPEERRDSLPLLAGPAPGVRAANRAIKRDPEVRRAARSVVKVTGTACGHAGQGSGWIAGDGIVVTNAHVVQGSDNTQVQPRGKGEDHAAVPIWHDDVNDVAILRVPGVRGVPALPIDVDPKPGTAAAALGFPGGGPYTVTPSRLGNTSRIPGFRLQDDDKYKKRPVTSFRGAIRGGNSGGPVVDGEGQVVTMVFGGRRGGHGSYGVPTPVIRRALDRAGPRVDTGECDEEGAVEDER